MQNVTQLGLIIAAGIMMVAGRTDASGLAIAENPQFRADWKAYKASTSSARKPQGHLSSFAMSPVNALSRDMPLAFYARHIVANSPQAICEVVSSRVRYTPDEIDQWQTGEETWNRKAGDCEDFAALVRDLCLARGFDAQMVIFHAKTSNAAHAVVIGNHNGTVWMSSNGDYEDVGDVANARERVIDDLQWNDNQVATYHVTGQTPPVLQPAARL